MITAISWWMLAAVFAIVVAVTALPVRLQASARSKPHLRVQLKISPFAGIAPYLIIIDSDRPKRKSADKQKTAKPSKRIKGAFSGAGPKLLRNAPRLIARWLRQVRFQSLTARGGLGLTDPAETGALFGMLCPLIYGLPPSDRICISVTPVFDRPCLEGQFEATASVIPLSLVPAAAQFVWSSFFSRAQ